MHLSSLWRTAAVAFGIGLASAGAHAQFGGGSRGPGGGGGSIPHVSVDSNRPAVVHDRTLEGAVRDAGGESIQGAVVYLKNTKTSDVESIIADDHGAYRFGDLASDTDYQLWAQRDSKKGPVKIVSQYDTRDQIVMNLKME
jgi:hypothetical protein